MTTERRQLIVAGIAAAASAAALGVLLWLRTLPAAAEWIAAHISAGYVNAAGHLVSAVPFSVFEWLVLMTAATALTLLVAGVVGLCRKRFMAVASGALAVAFLALNVLNLYTLTAGFAYYRDAPPVPESTRAYTDGEAQAAAQYFLDDFTELSGQFERDEHGMVISPYTPRQMSDRIAAEYARLGDWYYTYTPRAKGMVFSKLMSALRLTGITFLPLAEPNVNTDMPASELPHTMAHEMAHAKGVAREGDANLVAYYLLITSDDDYLRYCGYYASFIDMRVPIADEEGNLAMRSPGVPEAVWAEYRAANAYWVGQPDVIGSISEFFNNLYLKLNGADNGTGSYNDPITGSDLVDTGEMDEGGRPVFQAVYSQLTKVYFAVYEQRANRA